MSCGTQHNAPEGSGEAAVVSYKENKMADLAPLGTSEGLRFSPQEQKHQQANSSSYEVSDAAFKDIISTDEPVRVLVEKDYNFAHEAPVYLAKLNKVCAPARSQLSLSPALLTRC